MGRVTQPGCDSTGGQRKNNIREEQRVRAKKKRRKKELIDLHCGLRKPGKRNRRSSYWQSNFVKLLHRFADIREEYGKETKIDGDLGKARNSKKISNRILARPVSGIYKNGAVSKEIRRSQNHVLLGDSNNARLEGNVIKLLQGYDTNAKCIVIDDDREQPKDLLLDPIARNILHPTPPSLHSASPILGKVDGKKRYVRDAQERAGPSSCADVPGLVLEKKKVLHTQPAQGSAIRRYEELCATICTEFEGLNLPEQLTADPLSSVKKKLRSVYAESFHNQFLKDMIKRGQILNERATPSSLCSNPILPEAVCSSSGYGESSGLIAAAVDTSNPHAGYEKAMKQVDSQANRNPFLLPDRKSSLLLPNPTHREKRKEVPSPNFIFGSSLMSPHSSVDKIESERRVHSEDSRFVENIQSNSSLEVICPLSLEENQKCLDDEMVATINMPVRQRDRKALLFTRSIAEMLRESVSMKPLIKRKNQRTQTTNVLNSRTKRHPGKGNAKATHQVNAKNLKHVPAILRRCNKVNLFDPPIEKTLESTQPSVLYTPLRFALKNSRDDVCGSDTSVLNVQTCVVASPSLLKDLGKNSEGEPDHSRVNDIFQKKSKRNPMIQKTVMFTKKDSRYLHFNDLVAERSVDSSNVCPVRQEAPQHQEKCVDCQRAAPSCYQSFYCSEKSNDSNYYSQELKEVPQARPLQVQQEPVVCEKLFVRKLQQHPNKNHTVCFVAVDRGEELDGAQDCGNIPPEKVYCQDDVADVGILKGVQSLKIFPMEDQRAKCTTQCIGNTVVLEEQPVKYLAFDDDSEARRIPIYVQSKQRPQFTSVDNTDANQKINYRLVSCPPEPAQKILLVPSHEQNKVMYVKEKNRPGVSYERVNQPRKMFFYRPSSQSEAQCEQNSNTCEVHVSKQNLVQIANAGHESISGLQQTEPGTKMRKSFSNWEEVHYRPSHEHTTVKDACTKTVYFK